MGVSSNAPWKQYKGSTRFAAAVSPWPIRRRRFAASRFAAGPVRRWASSPRPFRRGCSAPDLFLATCYSYFSCQCHLFINGLIASQRPRGFSGT
jgi:hypothetical protein